MELVVQTLDLKCRSLSEVLELVPDRALVSLLDGPGGRHGVLAFAPALTSALIESQTVGQVLPGTSAPRRPTRTDAAMVMGCIDTLLSGFEALLQVDEDAIWTTGYRYASFVEDPRPLGLLLDDLPYLVMVVEAGLGRVARPGQLILALPEVTAPRLIAPAREEALVDFTELLSQGVLQSDCLLDAILARITLPLQSVMALHPGQALALPGAALDRITLEGIDARTVATARLGQQRGLRAVRIGAAETARHAPPAEVAQPPPLRAVG